MLANGTAGIRASAPDAIVLFGGPSEAGMAPQLFVDYVYTLGGKDCFDVLTHHPFDYLNKLDELAAQMQKRLNAWGDSNKPIWFTGFGTLSDPKRSEIVTQVFAERKAVPGFFWFGLRDSSEETWGFMRTDWSRKEPAYTTFKTLLSAK